MEWLEVLRRKASVEGNTIHDSYNNQIENFINTSFADSPTYLIVDIDGEEYETRLITEKRFTASSSYETKKLQLRPHVKVDAGKVARFKGKNWLIVFFEDRELEPKAHIRFCNNNITMENGNVHPCVIDSRASQTQKIVEERWVDLSPNTLRLTVGYNDDTKQIRENDRFVINGTAWEVQGVDRYSNVYKEVGTVEMSVKKVALRQDEIPEPEEKPIPEELHAVILGDREISIGETKQYTYDFYIDGQSSISKVSNVDWASSGGLITGDGSFTAPDESGDVLLTLTCEYVDGEGGQKTIETNVVIDVFNPFDWGWG